MRKRKEKRNKEEQEYFPPGEWYVSYMSSQSPFIPSLSFFFSSALFVFSACETKRGGGKEEERRRAEEGANV